MNISIGLFLVAIILAGFSYSQFGTAAGDSAIQGDIANAEFALSIGFAFIFGALAAAFTGISELMAEKRHREILEILNGGRL